MNNTFKKYSAQNLHYLPASDMHPADTYFHFSFANYHNPDRVSFGALRVLNDDDIKPHGGFGKHPHRDMEIITYLISGELTHWDNVTDIEETLGRGDVQTISAGSGVWHSEQNLSDKWTRLLQIWILPPAQRLPVKYNKHNFTTEERRNRLLHIVGNNSNKDEVKLYINQDVNIYVSEVTDNTTTVSYKLKEGRQAYICNFEGSLDIKGLPSLDERDSLEVVGQHDLEFSTNNLMAHFIIIEMATPL
ncbi:MAG: pirin family protein [Magnetococcales bacterium]|nr:pirin family protein [Magnetococcales bacterium]